jgi:hypothetical protein
MSLRSPRYIAGGTIEPSRIVKIDATAAHPFTVIAATTPATDKMVGISQEGTRKTPGVFADTYAAADNEHLQVYGPGHECLLKLGGTVTQGDYVTAGAAGVGVAAGTVGTVNVVGFALENGVSGDLIRVFVHPQTIAY